MDVQAAHELQPTPNTTVPTLMLTSSPTPVIDRCVEAPGIPASKVDGEKVLSPATNRNSTEDTGVYVPGALRAFKSTQMQYAEGERPTPTGRVKSSTVPNGNPTSGSAATEAAGIKVDESPHRDKGPEGAKAIARMLTDGLRPTPVRLMTVDAPGDPDMTVAGEKDEKSLTYRGDVERTGR